MFSVCEIATGWSSSHTVSFTSSLPHSQPCNLSAPPSGIVLSLPLAFMVSIILKIVECPSVGVCPLFRLKLSSSVPEHHRGCFGGVFFVCLFFSFQPTGGIQCPSVSFIDHSTKITSARLLLCFSLFAVNKYFVGGYFETIHSLSQIYTQTLISVDVSWLNYFYRPCQMEIVLIPPCFLQLSVGFY